MLKYVDNQKISKDTTSVLIRGKIFSEKKYYKILIILSLALSLSTLLFGDLFMPILEALYFFIAAIIIGIALGTFSFLWLPILFFSSKLSKLEIESRNNKLIRFFIFFSPLSVLLTMFLFASNSIIFLIPPIVASYLAIKTIRMLEGYTKSGKLVIKSSIIISIIQSSLVLFILLVMFLEDIFNF